MNHQGRLLDASGAGLTGTSVMTFKIYDAESGEISFGILQQLLLSIMVITVFR